MEPFGLFLRPHMTLKGKTPAVVAGVKYPYRNWQDIVAGRRIDTISQANATSMTQIPELPEGVRYSIIRKRIIKRPKRKHRRESRERHPVVMMVRG